MDNSTPLIANIQVPTHAINPHTGEIERVMVKTSFLRTDDQKVKDAKARLKAKGERRKEYAPYPSWHLTNTGDGSLYLTMLSDDRLTATDKLIWHGYASFVKIGNWVCTQQKLISYRLKCNATTISIATHKLVQYGYIERKEDSTCEYRIPKPMAYCGSWKMFNVEGEEV